MSCRLVEKPPRHRGLGLGPARAQRTWHLDFDGGGATVADQLTGELRTAARLEMGDGTALGRAAVRGVDQPIDDARGIDTSGCRAAARAARARRRQPRRRRRAAAARRGLGRRRRCALGHPRAAARLAPLPRLGRRRSRADLDRGLVAARPVRGDGGGDGDRCGCSACFGGALALATLALVRPSPARRAGCGSSCSRSRRCAARLPAGRLASAVRWLRARRLRARSSRSRCRSRWRRCAPASIPRSSARGRRRCRRAPPVAPEAEADFSDTVTSGALRQEISESFERRVAKSAPMRLKDRGYANLYAPDPDARVQTGPGRPDWSWQRVSLGWSGPVTRDQQLVLWLSAAVAQRRARARARGVARGVRAASARAAPAPHGAELGRGADPRLDGGARARGGRSRPPSHAPSCRRPSCSRSCARACSRARAARRAARRASRLALSVSPERLELRLGVDVAAESAVPLPSGGTGEAAGFTPDTIAVDGRAAEAVRRDAAGQLWLRARAGQPRHARSPGRCPRARPSRSRCPCGRSASS